MNNRKRFSEEGIGRIWKSTLAKTVDSTAQRTKKDGISQCHPNEGTSRKSINNSYKNDENDDLDPINVQAALQNIRSLAGTGSDSEGQCENGRRNIQSRGREYDTASNLSVKSNCYNNAPTKKNDQFHDKRFNKNNREVKENRNRAYVKSEVIFKSSKGQPNGERLPHHHENWETVRTVSSPNTNDFGHDKQWGDKSHEEMPLRLRNKKTEEIENFRIKVEERKPCDEKCDEKLEKQKVVVYDMMKDAAESTSGKEIDAFDKWKNKRQNISSSANSNSSNFDKGRTRCGKAALLNLPKKPLSGECKDGNKRRGFLVSSEKVTPKCSLFDNEAKESSLKESSEIIQSQEHSQKNLSEQDDENGEAGKQKICIDNTVKPEDDSAETIASDDEQRSAMDKIQNLFQSYISPVTQKTDNDCSSTNRVVNKTPYRRDLASSIVDSNNSNGVDDEPQVILKYQQTAAGEESTQNCSTPNNINNRHRQEDVDKEVCKNMEDLHIREDKGATNGQHQNNDADQVQDNTEDPLSGREKLKYPPSSSSFMKSPASIPSGFSSDYDVGIISQSETEDESPHPCAANLFPPQPHSYTPEQQQEDSFNNKVPSNMQWPRFYGNHNHPMPRQPMPFPPWYHPHFNHESYFRHPYMPHQSPFPGFMGMDSPSFSNQPTSKQTPSGQSNANTLVVPAETFGDKDSINKVIDFVAMKTEEWNKFMIRRHGQLVPLDVVINVTLPGMTEDGGQISDEAACRMPSNSFPAPGWQFPMCPQPNNMAYCHPFWPHHYPNMEESGAYSTPHESHDTGVQHTEGETERRQSLEEKLLTKVHHSNHPSSHYPVASNKIPEYSYTTSSQSQSYINTTTDSEGLQYIQREDITDSEDIMKRSISSEDGDNSEAGEITKKRVRNSNDIETGHAETYGKGDNGEENDKSVSSRKSKLTNSVSSFLNPNDLKNDWRTPPKHKLSHSTANKPSKYYESSQVFNAKEKERDRSPHSTSTFRNRCYRSNQHNRSFTEGEEDNFIHSDRSSPVATLDTHSSKTSYDQMSVCVVERKNCLKELNSEPSPPLEKGYEPITGNWHEICPEPTLESPSISEQLPSTPQSGSSFQEDRRRSDSVLSYSSDDRSPLAKDYRLCKTPGAFRDYREETGTWKKSLMQRSKSYRHRFIDTHCHIDFLYHRTITDTMPFTQFMEEHSDSFPVNYEGCIAVFCNPKVFNESTQAYAILRLMANEEKVWVAIGCHPKNAGDFMVSHLDRLREFLLDHPRTVALGEIGLDYSKSFYQQAEVQKKVFIQQLRLALELKLPLVIHCRDADKDCLEIMKRIVPTHHKIHLHCFTRHIGLCRQWMDHFPNLFVGFTPVITYASARDATETARLVPLDRLLLETDAPYFVPLGVPPHQVKKVSHPGFGIFTAERIADLKGVSVDTVLEACRKNTKAMYGI